MTNAERYQFVKYAYNNREPVVFHEELAQELAEMTDVITPELLNRELADDANCGGFKQLLLTVAGGMNCDLDVPTMVSLAMNEKNGKNLRRTSMYFMVNQTQFRDESVCAAVRTMTNDADAELACEAVCEIVTVDPAYALTWTAEQLEGFDGIITNESAFLVGTRAYVLTHGNASPAECAEFIEQCCDWRDAALQAHKKGDSDPVFFYHSSIKSVLQNAGLYGDLNADGRVTAGDARLALRASALLETLDMYSFMAADLDGGGKISAGEARTILRVSAKLETI